MLKLDRNAEIWDKYEYESARFCRRDTQESREEYPEGFKWKCYGMPGDDFGCQMSRHEPGRSNGVRAWRNDYGKDFRDVTNHSESVLSIEHM